MIFPEVADAKFSIWMGCNMKFNHSTHEGLVLFYPYVHQPRVERGRLQTDCTVGIACTQWKQQASRNHSAPDSQIQIGMKRRHAWEPEARINLSLGKRCNYAAGNRDHERKGNPHTTGPIDGTSPTRIFAGINAAVCKDTRHRQRGAK